MGSSLVLIASVGATSGFALVALLFATLSCEEGCSPGSRWAPGAPGPEVQLWALAVPAFLAACVLVWAVATGRRWTSLTLWTTMMSLLVAWCLFTGVVHSTDRRDYLWWVGLLLAGGGGFVGFALSRGDRRH